MSRPSAAAYVWRPHVASARERIRAAWPAVSPSASSRTSPDWSMRRSRLAARPPATHSQKASRPRPGRVSAAGMPGPIVTGHSCRCAFSHTSAACSGMGQAISTRSSGPPAFAMRRRTSSTSASQPPAQNMVSVLSFAGASVGLISRTSRSAFEAGAGATASMGAARFIIRRGTSSPGNPRARGVTRVPGSMSSSRRSSGDQITVGSSMWRSPAWIGQTAR